MSIKANMTALANAVRSKFNVSGPLTVQKMIETICSDKQFLEGSLTSVTIQSGVTKIRDYAFKGCSSLTSVTIPDSVTEIGEYAFGYCSSLTSVTIPASVTKIGNLAFGDCSSLTSVTIPDSVTEIGIRAFEFCSSLTDIYCGFSEGAVDGAPWGADNASIHYNSTGV